MLGKFKANKAEHTRNGGVRSTNYLHGLWNPDIHSLVHKGSPIMRFLSRINPIPHIDTYFFKINSKIFSSYRRLRPS
jgi:hypothetical protein